MSFLAEIPYPVIDPILVELGPLKIRWYGVTYVLAFVAAYLVLRGLARRGRWPVAPEKVMDVLFWGILGVFVGGRLGHMFFYALPKGDFRFQDIPKVWEGGMSFHGGLLGVVVAYTLWARKTKTALTPLFDGLALATPIGIFFVRCANFINAELWGRVWDGPWAMRFPNYLAATSADGKHRGPEYWTPDAPNAWLRDLRHPSQLYEALAEGLLLFLLLRWFMLGLGWAHGRIMACFLLGYGTFRFFLEYTREPEPNLPLYFNHFTHGQLLCFAMIVAGVILFRRALRQERTAAATAGPEGASA